MDVRSSFMEHADDEQLVEAAGRGDANAVNLLFSRYRDRLQHMINLRINVGLRGRIDASDVIQEAYVEATRTIDRYFAERPMPFYLWLRHLTGQKLIQAHRNHMGAQRRTTNREVPLPSQRMPEADSESIALQLAGRFSSPSNAAVRAETKRRIHEALERMRPMDREVLVLRHFEHLSSPEVAVVLGISPDAVKKRYVRALEKLEALL